jgi:outer membrane protein TolC
MAMEELNVLKNSIGFIVSDSLSRMERRRRLVELYTTGMIPQAEQSLESALIGYRVGKVDFLTLLDGRVNLFNYEKELYESKAEYMMQLARLEAAVGSDVVTTPTVQLPSSPAGLPELRTTPSPAAEHSQHH